MNESLSGIKYDTKQTGSNINFKGKDMLGEALIQFEALWDADLW